MNRKENEEALRTYIKENARPVELAWYNYCFENGTIDEAINEIIKYQNPDGGFGHGLEADFWSPKSSPIATNDAIIRLNMVNGLVKGSHLVNEIVRYLASGDAFDRKKKKWLFAIERNREYPHAIWWVPEKGSDGIEEFNPTVSLASFVVCYGEDDGYYADIVREAIKFLENADKMGGDNIKCFLLAYDLLFQNNISGIIDLEKNKKIIQEMMLNEICADVSKYGNEYVTAPSDFFVGKYWQFYSPKFSELIKNEIDNFPNILLEDGGFDIYWEWYTDYPEFEQAKAMWRPKVSLERLLFWKEAKERHKLEKLN